MTDMNDFRLPDPKDVERVVPPTGAPATLTILSAAAMSVLAVFAVTLVMAASRLADHWSDELGRAATVRVAAPDGEAPVSQALAILAQTPGVASARALEPDDVSRLLVPWLGADLALDRFNLPRLIEVTEGPGGIDAKGLRLRLAAEIPGATFDDHATWRESLVTAASRLRALGWVALTMIGAALVAIVLLAVSAALAANAQVIAVLRTLGAQDRFVTRAFTRRFTLRVVAGSGLGTGLGALGVLGLPRAASSGALLTDLGLAGTEWLTLVVIPLVSGVTAFATARIVALKRLKETR